jgi:hypothetical protein
MSAQTITTRTPSKHRIVGAANVGSTNYAVLQDVIKHDTSFQHRIVGATSISAPTSKCLQKDFLHIFYGSELQKMWRLGGVWNVESTRPFHSK